jgi:hypothetical protein
VAAGAREQIINAVLVVGILGSGFSDKVFILSFWDRRVLFCFDFPIDYLVIVVPSDPFFFATFERRGSILGKNIRPPCR